MRGLRLYARLVNINIQAQLQYKMSAFMRMMGTALLTGAEFLGLWALFSRFDSLDGWSLEEVCVFYGIAQLSFGISKVVTAGFDHMPALVRTGAFDRLLLRPRSIVLQLMGHEFTLRHGGRALQGVVVLAYGLASLAAGSGPETVELWATGRGAVGPWATGLLILWAVAGGVMLFWGLFVLQACFSFKTIEAMEIANVFTYGGVTAASYPVAIYARWFRRFFTFVVPIAAITFYPTLILIGRTDYTAAGSWIGWASPAAGVIFFSISLLVWRRAVRWYTSTGS